MKATLRRPYSPPQDKKIKNKRIDRNGGSPLGQSSDPHTTSHAARLSGKPAHIFLVSEQRVF